VPMGQPSSATRGGERGTDTKSSGVDDAGLAVIDSAGKTQLSNMYALLVISSLMFDGRDPNDILELAADSVSSLTRCATDAAYRIIDGSLTDGRDPGRPLENELDTAVAEKLCVDREIHLVDGIWRYALTLRALRGTAGVLVVRAATAPSPDELFLLKALTQQTAAAMIGAAVIERERDQQLRLVHVIEERDETIEHLARVVNDLERHERIHEALIALSTAGAGEAEIAAKLHELTSLAVGVEDAFGNLRAWAGTLDSGDYRCTGGVNREEVLRRAAASAQPAREGGRLFSVVRSRGDVLGVLVLFDPDGRAGTLDSFTLDYGATVLALELSHRRALAQAELRRRRDLIEDLLAGTDNESAYARAEALEHNLRSPHCVVVLHWENIDSGLVAKAAAHWAKRTARDCLLTRRHAITILVSGAELDNTDLHRAISADVGSDRGSIGIGSLAEAPSALPRSFSEAQRALKIKQASPTPYGSRRFEDLGVYRILDSGDGRPEVRGFVQEWLGALLDYDRTKGAELVKTLAHYLDCGGNYDLTAQSLQIHRSTLRYRLARIREIAGRDLQDVDTRLNLHLATRVLGVLGGTASTEDGHRFD
ncbi:PucR family transcriptional regulator, partial [Mycobacterium sp.]|uniref:PucR family transcriptional regulator n=2 Tax=Mycobacterium sp. TaxID=1785 RepID=UPI003BB72D39